MKKKITLAVVCVLAVLAFAGIYILYGHLSESYAPALIPEASQPESAGPGVSSGDGDTSDSDLPRTYPAPDFTVVDREGTEHTLSQYFGKPIVLNFWASWCPPCKAEMPHFEEAYNNHTDVQFMMINATTSDDRSAAEDFIADSGYTFPVFYDLEGTASYIYGTGSLPVTYFIDSEGNLVTYYPGSLSEEILEIGIGYITDSSTSP